MAFMLVFFFVKGDNIRQFQFVSFISIDLQAFVLFLSSSALRVILKLTSFVLMIRVSVSWCNSNVRSFGF
jgi:hypothetical protein